MKHLTWLCLPIVTLACASASKPPAQVVEPLPAVPEAPPGADIGVSTDPGVPAAPSEPFPPVNGTLAGKPWELKGAGTVGPVQKDGTVTIALGNYSIDCEVHEQDADARTISLVIPWKAHAKVDLAKLKGTEAWATTIDEKKKKPTNIRGWKPKGSLEVVGAPTGGKSSGRIKIELTSGKDAITAEIPVRFCFPE